MKRTLLFMGSALCLCYAILVIADNSLYQNCIQSASRAKRKDPKTSELVPEASVQVRCRNCAERKASSEHHACDSAWSENTYD